MLGQGPLCLLLHRFKSGYPVPFGKGKKDMGKQVEVRCRKYPITQQPVYNQILLVNESNSQNYLNYVAILVFLNNSYHLKYM